MAMLPSMNPHEPFVPPLSSQNATLAMLLAVHYTDSNEPMHHIVTHLCVNHEPIRAVHVYTVPPEGASHDAIGSFHIEPPRSYALLFAQVNTNIWASHPHGSTSALPTLRHFLHVILTTATTICATWAPFCLNSLRSSMLENDQSVDGMQ